MPEDTMSSYSTILAVISLGVSANALNGLVISILGSLALRHQIGVSAAIALVASVSAAMGGVAHTFLAPRMPDLRNTKLLAHRSAATRETISVLIYAPVWGAIAAVAGFCAFWLAEYIGANTGMPGVKDVTLAQLLLTSVIGTSILAVYCGASFHYVGQARTFSFFLRNHCLEFLEWAEHMRREENAEAVQDPEKVSMAAVQQQQQQQPVGPPTGKLI